MDDSLFLIEQENELRRAKLAKQRDQKPFGVQVQRIELTTARSENAPLEIKTFKSLYIQDATDTTAVISVKPMSADQYQSAFKMKNNSSWTSDESITKAYLHWDAQPGKFIELVLFVGAEFRSGTQISVNSGGVSISEGQATEAATKVTLAAATVNTIAPANTDRKLCIIENATSADIFISGTSTINGTADHANRGIRIPSGGFIEWRNTGVLYGYSVSGGSVYYMEQE